MSPPFNPGDRVRLVAMPGDPDPIPAGVTGTVVREPTFLLGHWDVPVAWDNGRTLGLVVPGDVVERLQ